MRNWQDAWMEKTRTEPEQNRPSQIQYNPAIRNPEFLAVWWARLSLFKRLSFRRNSLIR
jgi:hypothetical protein